VSRATTVALALLALGLLAGDAYARRTGAHGGPHHSKKADQTPAAEQPGADGAAQGGGAVTPPRGALPGGKPAPSGGGASKSTSSTDGRSVVQRESHIEFDERLVQGQSAAGAIYLFQRGQSEFRSMVKPPDNFRERTVRPILPAPPRR
jgi:hypothetical protein